MLTRHRSLTWLSAFCLTLLGSSALVSAGCKKSDDASADDDSSAKKKKKKKSADDESDDSDKPKKKKKADDDSDDSDGTDSAKAKKKKKADDDDKGDDDSPTKKAVAPDGPFTANIEGTELKMKYGKASASFGNTLHITLSTEKTPCSFAPPSDDSYQVEFDLSPGPGGTFFAGQPVGVATTFNSQKLKLKQTYASPYEVTAKIEPFKLKEGEHVKGSLEFDVKTVETKADTSKKTYEYTGSGNFDVVLCEDSWGAYKKLDGQPTDAPTDDVAGNYAGEKFAYKTALARVYHDRNNDEDYLESIEFYPTDDVTCSNSWENWKKLDYFTVRSIGGSGSKHKILGKPQPVDPSFSIPKDIPGGKGKMGMSHWFGGGMHRGWIQFDKLEFKGGGVVSGTVYADSAADAKAEETGKIGGKFEAKVCSSSF